MLISSSIETCNTCHDYLSVTILKQSKFERVPCLIMSKDSVYTFHEVSSKRNSMLMCVCKTTTYELIFVSDCLTVYVYRLTNSNLYFVIKT